MIHNIRMTLPFVALMMATSTLATFSGCARSASSVAPSNGVSACLDKYDYEVCRTMKFFGIELSHQMPLSDVLEELNLVNTSDYVLAGDDIDIPPTRGKYVKDIDDINAYLKAVTNYQVKITDNAYDSELPRVVRVVAIVEDDDKYSADGISTKGQTLKSVIAYLNRYRWKQIVYEGKDYALNETQNLSIKNIRELQAYVSATTKYGLFKVSEHDISANGIDDIAIYRLSVKGGSPFETRYERVAHLLQEAREEAGKINDDSFASEAYRDDINTMIKSIKRHEKEDK